MASEGRQGDDARVPGGLCDQVGKQYGYASLREITKEGGEPKPRAEDAMNIGCSRISTAGRFEVYISVQRG